MYFSQRVDETSERRFSASECFGAWVTSITVGFSESSVDLSVSHRHALRGHARTAAVWSDVNVGIPPWS